MNTEWLLAFIGFAFATAGTPGPNNAILAASAANYGLRRTLPAVFGVSLGFAFMIAAAGLGLGGLFQAHPQLAFWLRLPATAFMLWLAWKIATARPAADDAKGADNGGNARGAPPGFFQMAAFQWVNPKGWAMVLSMMGVFAGHNAGFTRDMLLMAELFAVIGTITAASWALIGQFAGRLLNARQLVWFNRAMAALLMASLILVWTWRA